LQAAACFLEDPLVWSWSTLLAFSFVVEEQVADGGFRVRDRDSAMTEIGRQ